MAGRARLMAAVAAAAAALALLLPSDLLNSCRSFPSKYFAPFNTATELVLNAIISAIVLSILLSDRSYRGLQALGCCITSSFTLLVTVVALKEALNDPTCSRHPNSVSGHVAFHLFALASLRDCVSVARGSSLLGTLRQLHPIATCVLLCNTYLGGYHSLLQMLLGVAVFALFYLLHALASPWARASPLRCALASATAFTFTIGLALSLPHERIPSRLWLLLVYFALASPFAMRVQSHWNCYTISLLLPPQELARTSFCHRIVVTGGTSGIGDRQRRQVQSCRREWLCAFRFSRELGARGV
jgi:hypothetical protein